MTARGVVYLATGNDLQHQLLAISRRALATLHPDLDQVVLSDRPAAPLDLLQPDAHIDYWRVEGNVGYASRTVKTRLAEVRRFERTLFLDNDVVAARPIDSIWRYVDRFDLAVALDIQPRLTDALATGVSDGLISQEEADFTLQRCGSEMPFFNTGVLLWRQCQAVDDFFQAWHEEWLRFQQRDQFAFVRALASTKLPLAILPSSFNLPVLDRTSPTELNAAYLLHFWSGDKLAAIRAWEQFKAGTLGT